MLAVRIAETDPAKRDARQTWLMAHQAHLRGERITVLQSGPLFSGDEQFGALVIAEVDSLEDLQRFSDDDPFVIHRVYRRVEILRWSRTIG